MIVTNDTSPSENEYLAAVRHLGEQTPSPPTYAIGDFVSGTTCGKAWRGRIWNIEGDRISIEIDGGWLAVPATDITH